MPDSRLVLQVDREEVSALNRMVEMLFMRQAAFVIHEERHKRVGSACIADQLVPSLKAFCSPYDAIQTVKRHFEASPDTKSATVAINLDQARDWEYLIEVQYATTDLPHLETRQAVEYILRLRQVALEIRGKLKMARLASAEVQPNILASPTALPS